jgi:hypothetical protein
MTKPPDHDGPGLDDHWLEEHAEQILTGHAPSCIAIAVEDAYALGIDTTAGARQVAAQLLEDGDAPCQCVRSPGPSHR